MNNPKNKFVSVVVDGKLSGWQGPNPDQDPTAVEQAVGLSDRFSAEGKFALPVVVEEIRPKGRPRKDDRNRKVVSIYLPEEVLAVIKAKAEAHGGTSVSSELAAIIESAMRRCQDGSSES